MEAKSLIDKLAGIDKQLSALDLLYFEYKQKYTKRNKNMVVLKQKMRQLKTEKTAISKKLNSLPDTQLKLVRAERDVKVAEALYLLLFNKSMELKVSKAGIIGNVRIVDPAIVQYKPIKPKKAVIVIIGLILGLFLGISLVLLRKAISQIEIEDPDMVEHQLNLPVYAIVPHSKKQLKLARKNLIRIRRKTSTLQVLAVQAPKDFAIESLRSLRTSLQFALLESKNNIITFGGSNANIGKSFLALNFSFVLASVDKRVLLVDADMRKGNLHEALGQNCSPGLSELIIGNVELAEAIQTITYKEQDNTSVDISFISTGNLPPNPSELLLSEGFKNILDTVSKQFDLVIIDKPPFKGITDGVIVDRLAGINFLVISTKQRQTLQEMKLVLKHLSHAGVKVQGAIFNDVASTHLKGHYYEYYGY